MSDISQHAHERLRERAGQTPSRRQTDQERYERLWKFGREATEADHLFFITWPQDDCAYRVAVEAGAKYLVARSTSNGVFITVIRAPERERRRANPCQA